MAARKQIVAPRDEGPTRVSLLGETVAVDVDDLTFGELDEAYRLIDLVPHWSIGRGHVGTAAFAFVTLKRNPTFAAWDDDKFRSIRPKDVTIEDGDGAGEA